MKKNFYLVFPSDFDLHKRTVKKESQVICTDSVFLFFLFLFFICLSSPSFSRNYFLSFLSFVTTLVPPQLYYCLCNHAPFQLSFYSYHSSLFFLLFYFRFKDNSTPGRFPKSSPSRLLRSRFRAHARIRDPCIEPPYESPTSGRT